MRYISDLHEGDQVSEIYLCKTKSPGTSKFGKSYYSLTLQDKTGMIDGMGTYQCDRTFRGDGLHFSQRTGNKLPGF